MSDAIAKIDPFEPPKPDVEHTLEPTHEFPTCSGLSVPMKCRGSMTLPRFRKSANAGMSKGTAVHAFLEQTVLIGRDQALPAVPEDYREFCASIDLSKVWGIKPDPADVELAVAYNPRTREVRHLGNGLERDYGLDARYWLCGTADIMSKRQRLVADYKVTDSDFWAPPPLQSDQLQSLGLLAARLFGLESVVLQTIRIGSDADVHVDEAEIDVFHFDLYESVLQRALLGDSKAPSFSEGPWCQSCPSYQACPAKLGVVRALMAKEWSIPTVTLNEETAPLVISRFLELKKLVGILETQIDEYAMMHPTVLPDGREYGMKKRTFRSIPEVDRALELLKQIYGEKAEKMVERDAKITQASIERIVGTKKEVERAMGELQRHGCVSVKTSEKPGVR